MCLAACLCIIRQVSPSFILRDDVDTFVVFEEVNDSKYVLAILTATLRVCLWDREASCFAVICIGGNSLNYYLRPEWFENGPHNFTICTYMNLSFDCVRFKLRSIALCLYDSICERYPFFLGPQEELSDLFTVFYKFESNLKQFLCVYPLCDCLFVLFLRHQIDLFFCYCTGWINGYCFVTTWKGEYSIHMELQFYFALQVFDHKLVLLNLNSVLLKVTHHILKITCEVKLMMYLRLTLSGRLIHKNYNFYGNQFLPIKNNKLFLITN